jgi:sugar lactone lactonase YvrE
MSSSMNNPSNNPDPTAQPGISTMTAFAPGDVFVGATLLNNPADDHAGPGRIFQFDGDLNLKGVLWVKGTTHLIYGLNFAPDGILWAQDPWAWQTVRVDTDGRQLENIRFDSRAFSKVHFLPDGNLLFTECLGGDNQPLPLTTRHRPLPGHKTRLGDGALWIYTPEGELLVMWEPEYHGGMSGSMAITHSVLSGDGKTLFYVSETGPRLMAFDLVNGRQLPDLRRGADRDPALMHFDLSRTPSGELLVSMGNRVDVLAEDGTFLRSHPLPGMGWAVIEASNGRFAYVGNWFTGELVKLDLSSGGIAATTTVAPKCMAGIAQYLPQGRLLYSLKKPAG